MSDKSRKILDRALYATLHGDQSFREDLLNDLTAQSNGWEDFKDWTTKCPLPEKFLRVNMIGQTIDVTISKDLNGYQRIIVTFYEVYDENDLFIDQSKFIIDNDGKVELAI